MQKDSIINSIVETFSTTPYPGDQFLQGTFEGCEPFAEVGAFVGKTDWRSLDAKMLDAHCCALNFFSEGGFRFFLPAYLIADLREELVTADPLFHLWHGFSNVSVDMSVGSETFRRSSGGNTILNARRYGAMTWSDYARSRLSVFTREETQAIVAYMIHKRDHDKSGLDKPRIDAALKEFWSYRAENAPSNKEVTAHLQEEMRFQEAIQRNRGANHLR
jgi:hypothetical protein